MDDNTVLDGSDASKSWREETAGLRREVMAERARAEARQPDPEATAPRARPAPPPLTDDPTADLPAAGSAAPPAEDVDGGWARWLAVTVFVAFLACVVGLVYVYR